MTQNNLQPYGKNPTVTGLGLTMLCWGFRVRLVTLVPPTEVGELDSPTRITGVPYFEVTLENYPKIQKALGKKKDQDLTWADVIFYLARHPEVREGHDCQEKFFQKIRPERKHVSP